MRTSLFVPLVLAASMGLAHGAQSGSQTENFAVVLTDLSPGDGITPSLNGDMATWHGSTGPETQPIHFYWWDPATFPKNPVNQGPTHVWQTDSGAFGETTGPDQLYESHLENYQLSGFELTPRTQITLRLDYGLYGDADSMAGASEWLGVICHTSVGWSACSLDSDSKLVSFTSSGVDQATGTLTLTFRNDTDAYARLIYGTEFYATGWTAPVPEPSTLALASSGLAALALRRRRRA